MPSNIKAGLSVVALIVAVLFAYWEAAHGRGHLFWFVIVVGMLMVVAMWIFPEADKKRDKP